MNDSIRPPQTRDLEFPNTATDLDPSSADASLDAGSPGLHSPAGSPLRRWEKSVASGARTAAQNVDSYVHVYPWGALAASAVIGLALGLLVSRG
ncbi:hypothetical protein OOT46_13695 [Aquabacterium sp. A7-Y]|uniref:glycine zipper domain-containing protein n=1 Tax=Aquabacterium sp. A7-Y TaxID=1349605 RepID=UPI00223D52FC|nr:hypothetical protein [Aquabacterium sp. A7-Y]MCW7538894.1 hypothetical protein [Aquabacterium sp. A7-Y]